MTALRCSIPADSPATPPTTPRQQLQAFLREKWAKLPEDFATSHACRRPTNDNPYSVTFEREGKTPTLILYSYVDPMAEAIAEAEPPQLARNKRIKMAFRRNSRVWLVTFTVRPSVFTQVMLGDCSALAELTVENAFIFRVP